MRTVLALLVTIAAVTSAHAQRARIDRIDGQRPGLFAFDSEPKSIQDRSISTGQRTETKEIRNVEITTLIPAKKDIVFGLEGVIVGAPQGERVPLRVVWRYPQPGLTNPETGATKFVDDYTEQRIVGETVTYYWTLGSDWTLVPGVWVLELWHRDRMLLSQKFHLVRP